jgi:hypothetical protein
MATLQSDKLHEALTKKMNCEIDLKKRDHNWYYVKDAGKAVASTFMSKGAKHTISDMIVSKMAKQLKVGTSGTLVKFVACTVSKEDCLKIIRATLAAQPSRT